MSSVKTKARRVGILYFLVMILAPIGLAVSGRFIVTGDAAPTARNIQTSEFSSRPPDYSGRGGTCDRS